MADNLTKETRKYNMSRIRSKDTKPEMIVRRFLHANGFRYRLHDKKLPSKPDIVLPKYKTVIFVHGCFWHGHDGCRYYVVPKTDSERWVTKIENNKKRDIVSQGKIAEAGWRIITLYECELRPKTKDITLENLIRSLKQVEN